jgi:hypothetical protein
VILALLAILAQQVKQVLQEMLAQQVTLDILAKQALQEMLARQVTLDLLAKQGLQVMVTLELLALQGMLA